MRLPRFLNPRPWVQDFSEPTPPALCGFRGVLRTHICWEFHFRGCAGIRSSVSGVLRVSLAQPYTPNRGMLADESSCSLGVQREVVQVPQERFADGVRPLRHVYVDRHRVLR